jgi:hypothetical protein
MGYYFNCVLLGCINEKAKILSRKAKEKGRKE